MSYIKYSIGGNQVCAVTSRFRARMAFRIQRAARLADQGETKMRELNDIYQAVLAKIGLDWTKLSGPQPQLADDIHHARHLTEWGFAEMRLVKSYGPTGIVNGGHLEFRRSHE